MIHFKKPHKAPKDQVWQDDLEEFTLRYINKLYNTLGKTVKYLSVPSSVYLSSTAYLASVCSGSKLNMELQTSHSINTLPPFSLWIQICSYTRQNTHSLYKVVGLTVGILWGRFDQKRSFSDTRYLNYLSVIP